MTPTEVELTMRLDAAQAERDDMDASMRSLQERVTRLEDVLRKMLTERTQAADDGDRLQTVLRSP